VRGVPLDDWATWSRFGKLPSTSDKFTIENGSFDDNNILDPAHTDHLECIALVKKCKTMYNNTNFHPIINNLV
jgi:hypothetical protein